MFRLVLLILICGGYYHAVIRPEQIRYNCWNADPNSYFNCGKSAGLESTPDDMSVKIRGNVDTDT